MNDQVAYVELIEAILADKRRAFGPLVATKVAGIAGLSLGKDGHVLAITGDPVQVTRAVVLVFETLAGKSSTVFTKKAIAPVRARYPQLALPPELA